MQEETTFAAPFAAPVRSDPFLAEDSINRAEAALGASDSRVTAIMRSILPLSRRAAGIRADSATELAEWPLSRIHVPTLIVTAADDLFHTRPGAEYSAERITGAQLVVLESGGHLMVGRTAEVRKAVAALIGKLEPLPQAA